MKAKKNYDYLLGRMKQLSMTREELGARVGLTPPMMSRRLQGLVEFSVAECLAILDALQLPLSDWARCFAADRVAKKGA